jgi:hypothetical protein
VPVQISFAVLCSYINANITYSATTNIQISLPFLPSSTNTMSTSFSLY